MASKYEPLPGVNDMPKLRMVRTDAAGSSTSDGVAPVSPLGRTFLHEKWYSTIFACLEFEQRMELEELRAILQSTLARHPRFHSRLEVRRKLGFKQLVWVPVADLDITRHVMLGELQPGEREHPELAVECFMARLVSFPPFDPSRPLWEAYLIHADRPHSRSACIFRIQHSLGDGASLMSILLACTRLTNSPDLLPTLPGQKGDSSARKPRSLLRSLRNAVLTAINTAHHTAYFLGVLTVFGDSPTPLKAGSRFRPVPCMLAVSDAIPMPDVVAIRNATGTTVNDVLVATLALAVDRYLGSHWDHPVTRSTRVTAVVLMNLRKTQGLQEIRELMEGGGKGAKLKNYGNQMGSFLLPLPLGSRRSPGAAGALDTLRRAKRLCDSKKLSLEAPNNYLTGWMLLNTAGPGVAADALRRMMRQTTLSFSNMVGPQDQVSLAGNPITAILPTVPPPGHALCCHLQSYNGTIRLIFYAALHNIPNPRDFCTCFVDAFTDLKACVLSQ